MAGKLPANNAAAAALICLLLLAALQAGLGVEHMCANLRSGTSGGGLLAISITMQQQPQCPDAPARLAATQCSLQACITSPDAASQQPCLLQHVAALHPEQGALMLQPQLLLEELLATAAAAASGGLELGASAPASLQPAPAAVGSAPVLHMAAACRMTKSTVAAAAQQAQQQQEEHATALEEPVWSGKVALTLVTGSNDTHASSAASAAAATVAPGAACPAGSRVLPTWEVLQGDDDTASGPGSVNDSDVAAACGAAAGGGGMSEPLQHGSCATSNPARSSSSSRSSMPLAVVELSLPAIEGSCSSDDNTPTTPAPAAEAFEQAADLSGGGSSPLTLWAGRLLLGCCVLGLQLLPWVVQQRQRKP